MHHTRTLHTSASDVMREAINQKRAMLKCWEDDEEPKPLNNPNDPTFDEIVNLTDYILLVGNQGWEQCDGGLYIIRKTIHIA